MVMHRALGRCEVGVDPRCISSRTEWHHRQRRREGDHQPSNGLSVCRWCHVHIHTHPEEARMYGWIVSFAAPPEDQPAFLRLHGEGERRWVTLTPGGTYA